MEARLTAILLATAMLIGPAALAGTASSPNITDQAGEDDPRTDGTTALPPSLDIEKAWIQGNTDTVTFTTQVSSLVVPHTTTVGIHNFGNGVPGGTVYEIMVGVPNAAFNGFAPCAEATALSVQFVPLVGGVIREEVAGTQLECITPSGERHSINAAGSEAGATVDDSTGELSVTIDRVIDDQYANHPDGAGARLVLSGGTTLADPVVTVYDTDYLYDTAGPGQDETV